MFYITRRLQDKTRNTVKDLNIMWLSTWMITVFQTMRQKRNFNHNIYYFVVDYDYLIWCHMNVIRCGVTNNPVVQSSYCYVTLYEVNVLLLHAIYVMHNLKQAKVRLLYVIFMDYMSKHEILCACIRVLLIYLQTKLRS